MIDAAALLEKYLAVRARTEALSAPLSEADQQLQASPSSSPTKWHRAHTTWFFETFVLLPAGRAPYDPRYSFLFNSYYEAIGERHPRPKRGLLSRPSAAEIGDYRRVIDAAMAERLAAAGPGELERLRPLVELGLAHEEQHQELILTDILAAFAESPLKPCYRAAQAALHPPAAQRWRHFAGGMSAVGAEGPGFAFDNELPRHRLWLEPFALAERLVTVGELKAFIAAKSYQRPALWLSDGWDWVCAEGIDAPGYARLEGGALLVYTLEGEREAQDDEPASHLSYYEAEAIARFLDARLPTEAEWEHAAGREPISGHFLDAQLRPTGAPGWYGDLWVWTSSAYSAYPGFRPGPGAIGEYNGKFMINQMVLRGGSCFTPPGHLRPSYRNFWAPGTRFQMSGLRLAKDLTRP